MSANNKKQPSDNMRKRLEEVRQRIEKSTQKTRKEKDTLPTKKFAILNESKQLDFYPDTVETIRPELNVARHADFIFTSPKSKNVSKRRERKLNNSNEFIAVIAGTTVSEKNGERIFEERTPTVTSARIFYALLQLWEQQGKRSDGWVVFSGRDIFKILNTKAGKKSYDILRRELFVLKSSNIYWSFCYKYKGKIEGESEQMFSLISYIKRINKNLNFETEVQIKDTKNIVKIASQFYDRFAVQIDKNIILGILQGHNKPFYLKDYLTVSEKSFDASILYTKIDLYLSTKRVWRREVTGLLEDLGISGQRYKKLAHRRKKAEEFVDILNSKRISTGLIKATLEKGANDLLFRVERITNRSPRTWDVHQTLGSEGVEYLVSEMVKWVGMPNKKNEDGTPNLVTRYAMSYPETVILDALSRFRADAMNDTKVSNKIGVFTSYLHKQVHLNKLQWIGKCEGKNCKYQPNLLSR
ncbi:MAG: hypothetical protein DHS20C07_31330 [Methyloligella sp.]|nr:MAG: hypothetical protein DHS20C07_31330 [Methyloligella sp.]